MSQVTSCGLGLEFRFKSDNVAFLVTKVNVLLIGDLWCDFGVICLSCACEDAAGFEVSKISLRFTLWPNYFDEIYDDVDGNVMI